VLRTCEYEGCNILTFGPLCVAHEPSAAPRRFPRGRPYPAERGEVTGGVRRIQETWPPLAEQVLLRLPSRS
jgi:hypothetical protein